MYPFAVTLAALAGLPNPPLLVFVPEESTIEGCYAGERIASVIALTSGTRLSRGSVRDQETLEDARIRHGADWALRGTRQSDVDGLESATISLARRGKGVVEMSGSAPVGGGVEDLLERIWPEDGPPIARIRAAGAASPAALEASCRNDAGEAYRRSGAAVERAIRDRVSPPPATTAPSSARNLRPRAQEPEGPLLRWAFARSLRRSGRLKEAVPFLRAVVSDLARGTSAPIWRREPDTSPEASAAGSTADGSSAPSTFDLFRGTLVTFENGSFVALDVRSGALKWRHALGRAEPHLTDAGDGLLLASLEHAVVAIQLEDGTIRWRVDMKRPAPEIAQTGNRLFVAGEDDVLALDRMRGDILWRYDPFTEMISGPSLVGSHLVVAAEAQLALVDPETGMELRRIDLGDEISAPLMPTPEGSVWAMIGSDQIVLVDPRAGEVRTRAQDLPGAEWPPAVLGSQLAVAIRRSPTRRMVASLDPAAKTGIQGVYARALGPVRALPNFAGVLHTEERPNALVARGPNGEVLWRLPTKGRVLSATTQNDLVLASVGAKVSVLEPRNGALLSEIDFSEPSSQAPDSRQQSRSPEDAVRSVVLDHRGGAALLENGVIYGFPALADPRPQAWLREARLELGRCHMDLKEHALAGAVAKQLLDRNPDDLDALALSAEADEPIRPRNAVEAWHRVSSLAPEGDRLRARAGHALEALAGIEARLVLERPILEVVHATARIAVVRTDLELIGFEIASPPRALWRRAAGDARPVGDRWLSLGGNILGVEDGVPIGNIEASALAPVGSFVFRLKSRGEGTEISSESPIGELRWTQMLGQVGARVLDAREGIVVTLDDSERGVAEILRADTGERVWMLPLGERLTGAWISGDRVLLEGERRFVAFDVETGRQAFTVPADPSDITAVVSSARGWILLSERKIRVLDRARGRVAAQLSLPEPITSFGISHPPSSAGESTAAERMIALLTGGELVALDLTRPEISTRLRLGRVTRLSQAGDKVLALEESGALIVIDPSRGLRPLK